MLTFQFEEVIVLKKVLSWATFFSDKLFPCVVIHDDELVMGYSGTCFWCDMIIYFVFRLCWFLVSERK